MIRIPLPVPFLRASTAPLRNTRFSGIHIKKPERQPPSGLKIKMELMTRIELVTLSLPRIRSAD